MAIATHPNQIIEVPLGPDDQPAETRPVLLCRAMSCLEHEEYAASLEAGRASTTDAEARAAYMKALNLTVTDWRNINDTRGKPLPFATDAWAKLSPIRVRAIAFSLRGELIGREVDFMMPLYFPASKLAKSAPGAAAGSAATPQPPTTPSSSSASSAPTAAETRHSPTTARRAKAKGTP